MEEEILVYNISVGQKNQLINDNRKIIELANWFFNPIEDFYDDWIISQEEVSQVENKQGIGWINSLTTKVYVPK